jgi:alkanesulfonate monooxygenase SsuD/methylene tetrahydromethanopterin reductase-like flavin-dependent oxidoreductase (luciferase family)
MGGLAKPVLRRVVAHADGWLPNRLTTAEAETRRGQLDDLAKEVGRDSRSMNSEGFTPATCTRMRISPGPGNGISISPIHRISLAELSFVS